MKVWQLPLWLLGLALLAGLGLLLVHLLLMPRLIHRHAEVRVPDLLTLELVDARERAAERGLVVRVARRQPHPVAPAGTVVDQQPAAGRTVREGRTVWLTVSAGPPASRLPSVVGLTRHQAVATLQAEGYRAGLVDHAVVPGAPAGVVAMQSPAAGSLWPHGRAVHQLVADAPPPATWLVPDLRGMTLREAQAACRAAGCVLAPVRYRRAGELPVGTVMEQDPPPGERIREGETVALVASTR